MRERASAYISIMRTSEVVASVPITASSRRVFRLMEEDCIELCFSLTSAVAFRIGDYCDDELFGRFVIMDEQMPAYNSSTGGFDYTLKMEAPYMALRNKVHTLPATFNNTAVRKETSWVLTDTLENHAKAIVDNAFLAGVECFNTIEDGLYPIEITAERAMERKCVSYGGIDMLSAIDAIAKAYETEWWVSLGVLHFGKCEAEDEPYRFALGWNVERMDIHDDTQDYCNAVFAFGGTENMPESYRRSLAFKVTEQSSLTVDGVRVAAFVDGDKKVTLGMLHGGSVDESFSCDGKGNDVGGGVFGKTLDGSLELTNGSACRFTGEIAFGGRYSGSGTDEVTLRLYAKKPQADSVLIASCSESLGGAGTVHSRMTFDKTVVLDEGSYTLYLRVDTSGTLVLNAMKSLSSGSVSVCAEAQSGTCKLLFGGTAYEVVFNPTGADYGEADYYKFAFRNGHTYTSAPSGFGVGSEYTLLFYGERHEGVTLEAGLEVTEVPLSWFTRDYDNPSSLWSVGENRLMLPVDATEQDYDIDGNRIVKSGLTAAQTVERSIVFGDIYPQCVLVVIEVSETDKRTGEEHSDGSKNAWQWTEYTIRCKTPGNGDFAFRRRYVKDGETLRMRFISDTDLQKALTKAGATLAQYKTTFNGGDDLQLRLAGMTFEAGFKEATQEYTLRRNDNYGCMLPNETLCPSVGDAFVLEGWDVRAMSALGLVEEAEEALLARALEYLRTMDEGQFVFTCEMMSEWMFHTEDGYIDFRSQEELPQAGSLSTLPFNDSERKRMRVWHVMPIPFITSEGDQLLTDGRLFQVVNGHYCFLLPIEGTRVTVEHGGLKNGSKTSRIIGYEFKLDKPYDTPRYTIGETEAYSRLKALEKLFRP